ncbi:hypothetical protein [Agromyces sp. Marseille-Q5079]|uniref:hypothetical protein n=1 Tax=Agromyces sp. Marseille-Q5079 TaxID=3439059 RepID=UPI003D9C7DE5
MSEPARRPSILRLIGWTLADELYAGWRQLALLGGNRRPKAWREGDDALPEVVLLPGVYEHWTFLRPLGNAMNAAGHRVRVVRGLGTNRIPIAETARRAALALAEVTAPASGFVIVAHSKGGLVGKHLLMDRDAELLASPALSDSTAGGGVTGASTEVADTAVAPGIADTAGAADVIDGTEGPGVLGLVAICTPFAGSRYARLFVDPTIRALMPRDETIVRLAAAASVNGRIVSISGIFDPHVPEGSELIGATNVQVPVAGHFRILRAPETFAAVRDGIALLAERALPEG